MPLYLWLLGVLEETHMEESVLVAFSKIDDLTRSFTDSGIKSTNVDVEEEEDDDDEVKCRCR